MPHSQLNKGVYSEPCHGQHNLQTWTSLENLWNVIKGKMDYHKSSNKTELLAFFVTVAA